jgi:hypothetical protein
MEDPIFRQSVTQAQDQARAAAIRRNDELVRNAPHRGLKGEPLDASGNPIPLEPIPFSPKNDPQMQALQMELNDAKDALVAARRRRQDATSPEERRAALEDSRDHEDHITAITRQMKEINDAPPEVFSPEMLDLVQRQLRLTSQGHVSDPNAAGHARDLREVFLNRIEDHYKSFRGIRRNYATGMGEFGEEGALEAGANLTTKLGAPTREALRGFDDMTPAQQELFRLGFGRRLQDMAANPQIGGAVANQFNTTAVRDIVEKLYPKSDPALWEQGQRLLRGLNREAITTRTTRDVLSGARTAELKSDMDRLMEPVKAGADLVTGRWGAFLGNLSTRFATQMGQQGATAAMRVLTETDPAKLLPLLNRLEAAAKTSAARRQAVTGARQLRALNAPNVGAVGGLEGEKIREAISGP